MHKYNSHVTIDIRKFIGVNKNNYNIYVSNFFVIFTWRVNYKFKIWFMNT
jgi:hypothetical protein